MGGHGASSGYKGKAAKELAELKLKVQNGEDIGGPYSLAKKAIYEKYGIAAGTKDALDVLHNADDLVKEMKNQAAQAPVTSDAKNLAGINGNPWPPDADSNHLAYQGGGGLGIWNQFGGGVANGGVSSATAKQMNTAVKSFTGSGYGSIRSAQASGNTTSTAGKNGQLCEDFIAAGVASGNGWNGGPTYRGIDGISNAAYSAFASLKAGDTVDPNGGGTASWSTHKNTSFKSFSGGPNSVVFVHTGASQPKGVSVDSISTCKGENEVLVSKDSRYKVQHVTEFTGTGKVGYAGTKYLLVYVEDD